MRAARKSESFPVGLGEAVDAHFVCQPDGTIGDGRNKNEDCSRFEDGYLSTIRDNGDLQNRLY
jgi:hypothetical protein